jgi:hypothetical protein
MLLVLTIPLFTIAADEIEKKTSVKIQGKTKIETDTYFQKGDRILETKCLSSLRHGKFMIQQKIIWKNSIVLEYDITDIGSSSGQFIHFHSIPGVNVGTYANPDGTMQEISLVTTNQTLLRSFKVINGMLSPLPMAEVERINTNQEEVKDLFHNFQSGKTSKDEFLDRAKEINKKNTQK